MAARFGGHTIQDVADCILGTPSQRRARVSEPALLVSAQTARRIPIEAVVATHLGADRTAGLDAYLRFRAGAGERIALLTLAPDGVTLRRVEAVDALGPCEPPSAATLRMRRFSEDDAMPDWPAVAEPGRDWAAAVLDDPAAYDRLVVCVAEADSREEMALLDAVPDALILIDGRESGQLAAYKAFKQYGAVASRAAVRAFVVEAVDAADGLATGRRLAQLAQRFLGLAVTCIGCAVREPSLRRTMAAQMPREGGRSQTADHWLEALRDVAARVGTSCEADQDAAAAWSAGATAAAPGPAWEIEFALPLAQPICSTADLAAFVEANRNVFVPAAERIEPFDVTDAVPAGSLARAVGPGGEVTRLVLAVGPLPGAVEAILASIDAPADAPAIVWIGDAPNAAQRHVAKRLNLSIRHVSLRPVCVDGHLGMLVRADAV